MDAKLRPIHAAFKVDREQVVEALMMQMAISRVLSVLISVLLLGVLMSISASADQAQYIYDDLGRLS